ncbi:diaminobutyrate acetyltransferase [Kerstersia sp.]|uniref:diaminobutyrate acetyltransferase n=1 Tax=Kerstersia sp. TaxID=1930783 RepID=UPI003F8E32F4
MSAASYQIALGGAPPEGQAHVLDTPVAADGAAIHALIAASPPLDLNSVYAYLLLCEHFSATSVVARRGAEIDGFVSAYLPPGREDTIFIWQVAVHERARGAGLAQQMLKHLLARPALKWVRYLETTIGPDNHASRRTFAALGEALGAPCTERPLFDVTLFGGASHEDERLLRFGPFHSPSC